MMIYSEPKGLFRAPKFVGICPTTGLLGMHRFNLSLSSNGVEGEWYPRMPPRLSKVQLQKFQRIRNTFMGKLMAETGEYGLILDSDGTLTVVGRGAE